MLHLRHGAMVAPIGATIMLAMTTVLLVAGCQVDRSRPSHEVSRPTISASPTLAASPRADADFDADGFADAALGGGRTDIDDIDDGVVLVVYGSSTGLIANRTQAWSETAFAGQTTESFGSALTTGDFDGDGYTDLAVGADDAPVDSAGEHAGFVRILYGTPAGLTSARSQRWTQNSPDVVGHAESHDGFGCSLAAANLGHGPEDDLAIGVHGEDDDSGAVNILYGTAQGLSARDNQQWTQASPGIADSPEQYDAFGLTLVTGHFRESGFDDLAVGVYSESSPGSFGNGAVHIINGSAGGLTAQDSLFVTPHSLGVDQEQVVDASAFSFSMAVGRFAGGPTDDLAVGAPFAADDSGMVTVIYGSTGGLRTDRVETWSQSSPGIQGASETEDTFGWALAAGRFGHDVAGQQFDDLAVRVPGELTTSNEEGGGITIIYGSAEGLRSVGSRTLTTGLSSEALGIDVSWRRQLTAIRLGDGDLDHLVVGSEDWISILPATSNGLTATGQKWTASSLGHPEIWIGLADKVTG